jgi:predicted amidophosphoribosyltransferase
VKGVVAMLRNCVECNQVFVHPVNKLCPDCTKKRNELFEKVKEYIRTHPNARIHEVVVDTGVEFDLVREFIDEGRLKIVPVDVEFRCQICGTRLSAGRICNQCKTDLTLKGDGAANPESPNSAKVNSAGKVHFLSRRSRESRQRD